MYPQMDYKNRSTLIDTFSTVMRSEVGPHIHNPTLLLFDLAHKINLGEAILVNVETDLERDSGKTPDCKIGRLHSPITSFYCTVVGVEPGTPCP